jgi:F-type H+-transporting ATPase subunit c
VEGIARQPEAGGQINTAMFIGIAFAEAISLYALVVAFLLIFVA